jgi:hypothetical protein
MSECDPLLNQRIKRPSHDMGIAQGSDRVEALLIGTDPENVLHCCLGFTLSMTALPQFGIKGHTQPITQEIEAQHRYEDG